MEEVFRKQILENKGMIQVDWRIPMEMEPIWRDAIIYLGEPKEILQFLISSFRERRRKGKILRFDFEKVKNSDSRKRIRVYGSDYWESMGYARERNISTSSFLSSLLRMEWILSSGFQSFRKENPELKKEILKNEEPWGA
ncbi:hypothetical protein CH352_14020 [Leptospira hartskeerlii]|uniref:Uncharacterized protein n=1 Tax=Leptospira hartskeerlii TaxID=2023177 RepID=A0A2M9X9U7_9LEPT|nr:hypothetical protein [Leptospira hartskeerlii]PJZ24473.1 hypothetical protein CH357_15485 [Leptospira hartskeerlii]PJZ32915.1 hypothetical protein CH352_14020 [Leptospira hartskeerlii]